MIQSFAKLRNFLFLVLIVGAPFHAFLITWVRSFSVMPDVLVGAFSVWRELVVICIGSLVLIELLLQGRQKPKLDILDGLIIWYAVFALVWLPFQITNITQWALGFRFDVLPLLFLLVVRRGSWDRAKMMKCFVIGALVVTIFGVLQTLVLPRDFLMQFGYSQTQEELRPGMPITACQYLEHTDQICRAISTFGGPTRYGTFLLLILGVVLGGFHLAASSSPSKQGASSRQRVLLGVLGMMTLVNIALTYSRSIWAACVGMIFVYVCFVLHDRGVIKWNKRTGVAIGISVVLLIVLGTSTYRYLAMNQNGPAVPQFFKSLFVRTTSTAQHATFFEKGLARIQQYPMGTGLGTAGPASTRYSKFLTENWYLQIGVETGVASMLVFLGILFFVARKLLQQRTWHAKGLLLGLVGICIAGVFTHSFEETTTSLILFGLLGEGLPDLSKV